MSARTSAIVALVAGPLFGAALPVIQSAIECHRAPATEACVWGKTLLMVSIAVSSVVVGATAALFIFMVLEWLRRKREKPDDTES
jgi:hypothetical protein